MFAPVAKRFTQDVSSMYLPSDPKIVNGHVIERTPEDQELIMAFAEAFLQPRERQLIASILAKDVSQLQFNAVEAEIIATRQDPVFLTGCSAKGYGFPIAQFYDFILTIDNALSYLRGLHIQVMNMRQIADSDFLDKLKVAIIHEDGVPWEIAELPEYKQLNETKDTEKKARTALQLDSEYTIDFAHANGANKYPTKERTTYEKCVDEAYIYNSPTYRMLIALQQGLFLVKHTVAEKLRLGPMNAANLNAKNTIGIGNWINSWEIDHIDQVPPYLGKAKDAKTALILKNHSWLDLAGGASAVGFVDAWQPQYYLFPKVYGLQNYPLNWHGFAFRKMGGSPADAQTAFGYPVQPDLIHNGHKVPAEGGPLAYWNCNFLKIGTDVSVWMKLRHNAVNALDTGNARFNGSMIDIRNQSDTQNFHAIEADWEAATKNIYEMNYHPAWACPRLSKAYAASGVGSVLQNMYKMLQRHFTAQYKNVDQLAIAQPDARRILMSANRSLTHLTPGTCPANSLPRYVTYQGTIVDEEEATFVSNGQKWIRSHIDPSRCSCEPLVRALSYSTGMPERPNGARQAEPRMMTLRMPMGTPSMLSSSDIQQQIDAKGHAFSEADVDLRGGGLFNAMALLTSQDRHPDSHDSDDQPDVDDDDDEEESDDDDDSDDAQSDDVNTDEDGPGSDDATLEASTTPSRSRSRTRTGTRTRFRRVSRKNNPDYKAVYRTNKRGQKQRFYVRK